MKHLTVTHIHEGKTIKSKVKPFNDAFLEIIIGKYKGNLIHIFSIIKK